MISIKKHFVWGSVELATTINLQPDSVEAATKQLKERREFLLREAEDLGELIDSISRSFSDNK